MEPLYRPIIILPNVTDGITEDLINSALLAFPGIYA